MNQTELKLLMVIAMVSNVQVIYALFKLKTAISTEIVMQYDDKYDDFAQQQNEECDRSGSQSMKGKGREDTTTYYLQEHQCESETESEIEAEMLRTALARSKQALAFRHHSGAGPSSEMRKDNSQASNFLFAE